MDFIVFKWFPNGFVGFYGFYIFSSGFYMVFVRFSGIL